MRPLAAGDVAMAPRLLAPPVAPDPTPSERIRRSRLAAWLTLALGLFAAPLGVDAQAPGRIPRIGLLFTGAPPPESNRAVEAFRHGLRELGHVEGRAIVLEHRWAPEGGSDQLPGLAADLVRLGADVIVTQTGGHTRAAM